MNNNIINIHKKILLHTDSEKKVDPSLLSLQDIARKLFILQAFRKELEGLEQLDLDV
jgi:hypothetical protein